MIFIPLLALLLYLFRKIFLKPGYATPAPHAPTLPIVPLVLPGACDSVPACLALGCQGVSLDARGAVLATGPQLLARAKGVAHGLRGVAAVGQRVAVANEDVPPLDLVCTELGALLAGLVVVGPAEPHHVCVGGVSGALHNVTRAQLREWMEEGSVASSLPRVDPSTVALVARGRPVTHEALWTLVRDGTWLGARKPTTADLLLVYSEPHMALSARVAWLHALCFGYASALVSDATFDAATLRALAPTAVCLPRPELLETAMTQLIGMFDGSVLGRWAKGVALATVSITHPMQWVIADTFVYRRYLATVLGARIERLLVSFVVDAGFTKLLDGLWRPVVDRVPTLN